MDNPASLGNSQGRQMWFIYEICCGLILNKWLIWGFIPLPAIYISHILVISIRCREKAEVPGENHTMIYNGIHFNIDNCNIMIGAFINDILTLMPPHS